MKMLVVGRRVPNPPFQKFGEAIVEFGHDITSVKPDALDQYQVITVHLEEPLEISSMESSTSTDQATVLLRLHLQGALLTCNRKLTCKDRMIPEDPTRGLQHHLRNLLPLISAANVSDASSFIEEIKRVEKLKRGDRDK